MSYSFDKTKGLIVVGVAMLGLTSDAYIELALDTGAERTIISANRLEAIGYKVEPEQEHYPLVTGSDIVSSPQFVLPKIYALGKFKENFPVYCHTLPSDARVDGLLGLDFLRSHVLKIDFINGKITLE
jgi:hypothetical protein